MTTCNKMKIALGPSRETVEEESLFLTWHIHADSSMTMQLSSGGVLIIECHYETDERAGDWAAMLGKLSQMGSSLVAAVPIPPGQWRVVDERRSRTTH